MNKCIQDLKTSIESINNRRNNNYYLTIDISVYDRNKKDIDVMADEFMMKVYPVMGLGNKVILAREGTNYMPITMEIKEDESFMQKLWSHNN